MLETGAFKGKKFDPRNEIGALRAEFFASRPEVSIHHATARQGRYALRGTPVFLDEDRGLVGEGLGGEIFDAVEGGLGVLESAGEADEGV